MKKRLAILLSLLLSFSLLACGANNKAPSQKKIVANDSKSSPIESATQKQTVMDETPETETLSVETETDSSTIGEIHRDNGIEKIPVITDKELNLTGEAGPMAYSLDAIQVSKFKATTSDMADYLGIEKDKEFTVVVIEVTVENTSDKNVDFFISQATLTTNTKEQVKPDTFLGEYIEGEFLGNVIHSGDLVYLLQNSYAEDISNLKLHIDPPIDENFDPLSDDIVIDLNFE